MGSDEDFPSRVPSARGADEALAEAEGGLYLPNPEPQGPEEYVFVAMEPSLRGTEVQQRTRIEAGVRNFATDWGTHFAARWFLGPSYHGGQRSLCVYRGSAETSRASRLSFLLSQKGRRLALAD